MDRFAARTLARSKTHPRDVICFHCQQCVEKYLKALLEELDIYVMKTHDLVKLGGILWASHPTIKSLNRGLDFLTQFAVDTRYPGEDATRRQAQAALRWMERIRKEARRLLGL